MKSKMKNKTIGTILIGIIIGAVVTAFIDYEAPELADSLYTILGLAFMVFGVWGGILLRKDK